MICNVGYVWMKEFVTYWSPQTNNIWLTICRTMLTCWSWRCLVKRPRYSRYKHDTTHSVLPAAGTILRISKEEEEVVVLHNVYKQAIVLNRSTVQNSLFHGNSPMNKNIWKPTRAAENSAVYAGSKIAIRPIGCVHFKWTKIRMNVEIWAVQMRLIPSQARWMGSDTEQC